MDSHCEPVRSLEQQESGVIRVLRCATCGARSFRSVEQLTRHESLCGPADGSGRLNGGS